MFRQFATATLWAGLLLGQDTAHAERIIGGPYVVNVTGRSATVVWVVESGEVSLGSAPDTFEKRSPVLRAERAGFTGLKPGTQYHYDSGAGKGSFRTPPAGNEPYEFVVFGDTRTRHDMHRRVIAAIEKDAKPEFVVHTGDLVTDGMDTAMWPTFFEIESGLLRHTAFFPALGNHERNSRHFYDFFQISTPYYSFDWGKAHFIVLNSDVGNVSSSPAAREAFWAEQRRWLEEELVKSQDADYRFVVAHHPPMTAVSNRQGGNAQMTALIPMFEKYRVTAGFFGHDHNYQHFLKDGIHYVITGGGGAPLYNVDKPPQGITQKVTSIEHFVRIRVKGAIAQVTSVSLNGDVLDEFEFQAAPAKK